MENSSEIHMNQNGHKSKETDLVQVFKGLFRGETNSLRPKTFENKKSLLSVCAAVIKSAKIRSLLNL